MTKLYTGSEEYDIWLESGKFLQLSDADLLELESEKVVRFQEIIENLEKEIEKFDEIIDEKNIEIENLMAEIDAKEVENE